MEKSWLVVSVVALSALCLCVSGMGMGKADQAFGGNHNNDERYQKWYDWMVKRQLGSNNDMSFGRTMQDGGKFLDWGSLFDGKRGKRQLSSFQDKFGNYQRFFTNFLQDWKSTFNGEKRALDN